MSLILISTNIARFTQCTTNEQVKDGESNQPVNILKHIEKKYIVLHISREYKNHFFKNKNCVVEFKKKNSQEHNALQDKHSN